MATIANKPFSSLSAAVAAGKRSSIDQQELRDTVAPLNKQMYGAMPGQPVVNLPTPPNSVSPDFQPLQAHQITSVPIDSDIDLQDAVDHARAQDQPTALSSAALSGLEASAVITPSMLAKHHLPDILLPNGPLAIRYILNCLTQSVPGFSRIPPPKARRLVVSALEIRGGGGPNGHVEFEKVGWGRWDARIRGQPPREGRPGVHPGSIPVSERARLGLSPAASLADSYAMSTSGLQIPDGLHRRRDQFSGSWAGDSMLSSHGGDLEIDMGMNVAEHEADKMSLDGSESLDSGVSSSVAEDIPVLEDDLDDDDATDEEDWAGIGPEALRHGSLPHRSPRQRARASTARIRSSHSGVGLAKSLPRRHVSHDHRPHPHSQPRPLLERRTVSAMHGTRKHTAHSQSPLGFPVSSIRGGTGIKHEQNMSLDMAVDDTREREAVEALLKMGSM